MIETLPPAISKAVEDFVAAAKEHLGERLKSVVLFGSGAEGKLRPTSDINLIIVLSAFEQTGVDALREPLRFANAAIHLTTMFLLETEIPAAAETFAVKFADVARRRKVLFGSDPFESISIPRHAEIARLRQVLLNLVLRMRSIYASRSLREEQLVLAIADIAGPLRASAAAILELQGKRAESPREALEAVAGSVDMPNISQTLGRLSEAREKRSLAPGAAAATAFELMELGTRMRLLVERL